MPPIIVNLDSAFDWTGEVRGIWRRLDYKGIGRAIAPQVSSVQWDKRSDELALIGLVSPSLIEMGYRLPQWEEDPENAEEVEDPLLREWRERQRGIVTNEVENSNVVAERRHHFDDDEASARSPRIGRKGAIEWYGIYVSDAARILGPWGLLDKVPAVTHHAPAIFLCPENINSIYPAVASRREGFRHALLLSSNPAHVNLQTTLLHELGHHFFPVHLSGARRYLSEALANLFCHRGLDREEQAWQLYKTWHLQRPEYSAYRPLSVLTELDADCRDAVAQCFQGNLNGWASLPAKNGGDLARCLAASLSMALSADAAPCIGLWCRELRRLTPLGSRGFFDWNARHVHFRRHTPDEHIPADLVLDLYGQCDLTPWRTTPGLPRDLWSAWSDGTGRWPEDCLRGQASRSGKVKEIVKGKPYGYIADDEPGQGAWFFHATQVTRPRFAKLAVGDTVHFTLGVGPKGRLQAVNVTQY
jgi:cold shock CspA family protein